MSQPHQRGLLLLQQGRYDLADREFRRHLSQDPDDPLAHAFLSLCLTRTKQDDEALREADEAVRCGPNVAFCHYVRGSALEAKKKYPEAVAAANQAIQLDPDDPDFPALLASIAIERRDWKGALAAADRGLALDAEHDACLNLRALALVQLGRNAEAASTLGSALADDPNNALTHTNQGWAYLHQGEHVKALEHFREALRIDPDMEWARMGIVEALKARFAIYRVMLSFFLWMGRQNQAVQWVVILGFVFGRQFLEMVRKASPALAPFISPLLTLSFAFLLMTWVSSPLFNFTLRFNKFGRLALTKDETLASNLIGGCFSLAFVFFVINLITQDLNHFLCMMYFGFLLFPMAVTFRQPLGRARMLASLYTAALALVGGFSLIFIVQDVVSVAGFRTLDGWSAFCWGAILSTWLGAFLGSSRVG